MEYFLRWLQTEKWALCNTKIYFKLCLMPVGCVVTKFGASACIGSCFLLNPAAPPSPPPPSLVRALLRDYSNKYRFQREGEKWCMLIWDMQQIHLRTD